MPEETAPASSPADPVASAVSVPSEWGVIEESYVSDRPGKTVVYIQDAHASLEAQENIAALIQYLVEHHGVKTVLEEGYEGPVPSDEYFGLIEDAGIKKQVAHSFMDRLRIGGAEYAHINRKQDFDLVGADSLELLLENINWYRESARKREAIMEDLKELESSVTRLAHRYFSKPLKEWMKLKKRLDEDALGLADYLSRTAALFQTETGKDLQAYPGIERLLDVKTSKDPALLEKAGAKGARLVGARQLFGEVEALENDLAAALLQSERDLKIFHYYKSLQLLRRLAGIRVTPSEYETVKGRLASLSTEEFAAFLAGQTGKSVVLSKRWEENIRHAVRFYELARARDRVLERKLLEHFDKAGDETAVLVFGGFHKENIKEILRRNRFSYQVITPNITEINPGKEAYYHQLMAKGVPGLSSPLAGTAARYIPLFVNGEYLGDKAAVQSGILREARRVGGATAARRGPLPASRGARGPRAELRTQEPAGLEDARWQGVNAASIKAFVHTLERAAEKDGSGEAIFVFDAKDGRMVYAVRPREENGKEFFHRELTGNYDRQGFVISGVYEAFQSGARRLVLAPRITGDADWNQVNLKGRFREIAVPLIRILTAGGIPPETSLLGGMFTDTETGEQLWNLSGVIRAADDGRLSKIEWHQKTAWRPVRLLEGTLKDYFPGLLQKQDPAELSGFMVRPLDLKKDQAQIQDWTANAERAGKAYYPKIFQEGVGFFSVEEGVERLQGYLSFEEIYSGFDPRLRSFTYRLGISKAEIRPQLEELQGREKGIALVLLDYLVKYALQSTLVRDGISFRPQIQPNGEDLTAAARQAGFTAETEGSYEMNRRAMISRYESRNLSARFNRYHRPELRADADEPEADKPYRIRRREIAAAIEELVPRYARQFGLSPSVEEAVLEEMRSAVYPAAGPGMLRGLLTAGLIHLLPSYRAAQPKKHQVVEAEGLWGRRIWLVGAQANVRKSTGFLISHFAQEHEIHPGQARRYLRHLTSRLKQDKILPQTLSSVEIVPRNVTARQLHKSLDPVTASLLVPFIGQDRLFENETGDLLVRLLAGKWHEGDEPTREAVFHISEALRIWHRVQQFDVFEKQKQQARTWEQELEAVLEKLWRLMERLGGGGDSALRLKIGRQLEIFGLGQDASFDEAKKAYKGVVRDNHPDRKPDDEAALKRFKEAVEAYEILENIHEKRPDLFGPQDLDRAELRSDSPGEMQGIHASILELLVHAGSKELEVPASELLKGTVVNIGLGSEGIEGKLLKENIVTYLREDKKKENPKYPGIERIIGIDPQLRKTNRRRGWIRAIAQNTRLQDQEADAIVSVGLFNEEHVEKIANDPARFYGEAAQEFFRILKPGGRVFLSLGFTGPEKPHFEAAFQAAGFLIRPLTRGMYVLSKEGPASLRSELRTSGRDDEGSVRGQPEDLRGRLGGNVMLMHHAQKKESDLLKSTKDFLNSEAPLLKETIQAAEAGLSGLSDTEILDEVNRIFASVNQAEDDWMWAHLHSEAFGRALTLRELFLHPTRGDKDLHQILGTTYSLYLSSGMLKMLAAGENKAVVEKQIKIVYLILRGLEIMSRMKETALIQASDIEEDGELLQYLLVRLGETKEMLNSLSDGDLSEQLNATFLSPLLRLRGLADRLAPEARRESLKNLERLFERLKEDPDWEALLSREEAAADLAELQALLRDGGEETSLSTGELESIFDVPVTGLAAKAFQGGAFEYPSLGATVFVFAAGVATGYVSARYWLSGQQSVRSELRATVEAAPDGMEEPLLPGTVAMRSVQEFAETVNRWQRLSGGLKRIDYRIGPYQGSLFKELIERIDRVASLGDYFRDNPFYAGIIGRLDEQASLAYTLGLRKEGVDWVVSIDDRFRHELRTDSHEPARESARRVDRAGPRPAFSDLDSEKASGFGNETGGNRNLFDYRRLPFKIPASNYLQPLRRFLLKEYFHLDAQILSHDISPAMAERVLDRLTHELPLSVLVRWDWQAMRPDFFIEGWINRWVELWRGLSRQETGNPYDAYRALYQAASYARPGLELRDELLARLYDHDAFIRARRSDYEHESLTPPRMEFIRIPFNGAYIPAYLIEPSTVPAGDSDKRPVVIISHGILGRKEHPYFDRLEKILIDHGIAVLRPDLPHHAEETATPFVPETLLPWVDALQSYIEGHSALDHRRTGFFGFSLSGNVALRILNDPERANRFGAISMMNVPVHDTFTGYAEKFVSQGRPLFAEIFEKSSKTELVQSFKSFAMPEITIRAADSDAVQVLLSGRDQYLAPGDRERLHRMMRTRGRSVDEFPSAYHFMAGADKEMAFQLAGGHFARRLRSELRASGSQGFLDAVPKRDGAELRASGSQGFLDAVPKRDGAELRSASGDADTEKALGARRSELRLQEKIEGYKEGLNELLKFHLSERHTSVHLPGTGKTVKYGAVSGVISGMLLIDLGYFILGWALMAFHRYQNRRQDALRAEELEDLLAEREEIIGKDLRMPRPWMRQIHYKLNWLAAGAKQEGGLTLRALADHYLGTVRTIEDGIPPGEEWIAEAYLDMIENIFFDEEILRAEHKVRVVSWRAMASGIPFAGFISPAVQEEDIFVPLKEIERYLRVMRDVIPGLQVNRARPELRSKAGEEETGAPDKAATPAEMPFRDEALRKSGRNPEKIKKKGPLRPEFRGGQDLQDSDAVERGYESSFPPVFAPGQATGAAIASRKNDDAFPDVPAEKMAVPAGVFLDAGELARLNEEQVAESFEELLILVQRHKGFDVYIDGTDRYPVSGMRIPHLQKLRQEHPGRVHLGIHDRAHLSKKEILLQLSFLTGEGTAEKTEETVEKLKRKYALRKEVLPVEYTHPGTLKAFLNVTESLKSAALIHEISDAYVTRSANGRWRVARNFAATLWNKLQSAYAVQWSA